MKLKMFLIMIIAMLALAFLAFTEPVEATEATTFLEEINERYGVEVSLKDITAGYFYMVKAEKWDEGIMIKPVRRKDISLNAGYIGPLENLTPFIGASIEIDPLDKLVKKGAELLVKLVLRKEFDLSTTPITTSVGAFICREKDKDLDYGPSIGLSFKVDF